MNDLSKGCVNGRQCRGQWSARLYMTAEGSNMMGSAKSQASRRRFLAGGSLLSILGSLSPARLFGVGTGGFRLFTRPPATAGPTIYERLAVRTRINAKGTYTYL